MKGIWLEQGALRFRDDLAAPVPGEGELLLRTLGAGICGTDLALKEGYYEQTGIIGHEFVAEVLSPGDLTGQRVVMDINIGCGHCSWCRSGLHKHCPGRKVVGIKGLQGAFAEYLVAPEANVVPVPATLPDHLAILAEPLAAALEITEQIDTKALSRALVLGAGRLGVLVARVLADTGLEVDLLVRNPARISFVAGTDVNCLQEVTDSDYPLVVDCTGNADGLRAAIRAAAPRAFVVIKSTWHGEADIPVSRVVVDEIQLVGSRCGPMDKAVDWLLQHPLDTLAFATYTFEEVDEAFGRARDPSVYKVVFAPDGAEQGRG